MVTLYSLVALSNLAQGQETQAVSFPNLSQNNQQQMQKWITGSTASNRVENLRTALLWNTLSLKNVDEKGNTLLHIFSQKADPEMLEVVASLCPNELFKKENNLQETPYTIINNQIAKLFTENRTTGDNLNLDEIEQKLFEKLIACKQILCKDITFPTIRACTTNSLKFTLTHSIIRPDEALDNEGNTIVHHFARRPLDIAIECFQSIPVEVFLKKNKKEETPLDLAQKTMRQLLEKGDTETFEKFAQGFSFIQRKTNEAKKQESQESCCIIV